VQPVVTGVNPEWKLIYRFIYTGDGQFMESADYRLQTSLAGAVSSATTAGAVSFAPSGGVAATTVQGAIEELDTEKSATSHTHSDATTSVAGFLSATDKTKLDGVASGATAYTDTLARTAVIASSISDSDTTHAPDGNSVFDALALKAPLASPTFTNTPAAPTAADNTATTQLATTAFAKSQDAVLARLPDQAVNMTYAASGSTGIVVADNVNIDFGTGNFTLVWRGSLPDWTPSSTNTWLITKIQDASNRWGVYIDTTTGYIGYAHDKTGGTSVSKRVSTVHGNIDNTTHEIVVVITRETASVAGSVSFYNDSILLETISIVAGTPADISNTGVIAILGYLDVRYAGTCSFAATYNRALSAAEVLDLYRNGISYADKWGSQTSLVTGDNSTFASDTGWWTKDAGASITSGVLRSTSVANDHNIVYKTGLLIAYKRYSITFTISGFSAGGVRAYLQGTVGTLRNANGTYTEEIIAGASDIYFTLVATGTTTLDIDNLTIYPIGATLALEPEGIQNDKWYGSANSLNASYPAAGWSLARNLNVPRTNTGQPAFLAIPASQQDNIATDGAVTIIFGTEIFDNTNNFASNTFTAPVSGKYYLACSVRFLNIDTAAVGLSVSIKTSNRSYISYMNPSVFTADFESYSLAISALADMIIQCKMKNEKCKI
jgi:hypothetical protein